MKWKSYWWGIELIAETPLDAKALKELDALLPIKAEKWPRDDGNKELARQGSRDDIILAFRH